MRDGSRAVSKVDEVGFVKPDYPGTVHAGIGTMVGLLYPRIVDIVAKMILELTQEEIL